MHMLISSVRLPLPPLLGLLSEDLLLPLIVSLWVGEEVLSPCFLWLGNGWPAG